MINYCQEFAFLYDICLTSTEVLLDSCNSATATATMTTTVSFTCFPGRGGKIQHDPTLYHFKLQHASVSPVKRPSRLPPYDQFEHGSTPFVLPTEVDSDLIVGPVTRGTYRIV